MSSPAQSGPIDPREAPGDEPVVGAQSCILGPRWAGAYRHDTQRAQTSPIRTIAITQKHTIEGLVMEDA